MIAWADPTIAQRINYTRVEWMQTSISALLLAGICLFSIVRPEQISVLPAAVSRKSRNGEIFLLNYYFFDILCKPSITQQLIKTVTHWLVPITTKVTRDQSHSMEEAKSLIGAASWWIINRQVQFSARVFNPQISIPFLWGIRDPDLTQCVIGVDPTSVSAK